MNRPMAHSFFTKELAATVTGIVYEGPWNNVGKAMVQGSVSGTGAVAATIIVYGSNDGVNWNVIGTITLTDTTSDSDVQGIDYPWMYVRADLTAISGTDAIATAVMAV